MPEHARRSAVDLAPSHAVQATSRCSVVAFVGVPVGQGLMPVGAFEHICVSLMFVDRRGWVRGGRFRPVLSLAFCDLSSPSPGSGDLAGRFCLASVVRSWPHVPHLRQHGVWGLRRLRIPKAQASGVHSIRRWGGLSRRAWGSLDPFCIPFGCCHRACGGGVTQKERERESVVHAPS